MPIGDWYRVRVRLASGASAELLVMVSDRISHSIVEAYAYLKQGEAKVWEGRVAIPAPTLLGVRIQGIEADVNGVNDPRWERLLLRIAFPTLVHMAESDSLPSEPHCLTGPEIQSHIDDFGFEGRPCEFVDTTSPSARRCGLGLEHGVPVAIDQKMCDSCSYPEFFERCEHLKVRRVQDISSPVAPGIQIDSYCVKGLLDRAEPPCRLRPCYEPTTCELPGPDLSPAPHQLARAVLGPLSVRLRQDYPCVQDELEAAYAALGNATEPEGLAAVGTACRRALSDLADAIFAPRPEPYRDMNVDAEHYKNRLHAYVRDTVQSNKNRNLLEASIDHIEARINAVNSLAAKGDHADWARAEAERCLLQTHLLIGDIITL